MRSSLYAGTVMHERLRPKRHGLSYRVFCTLIDLDELEELGDNLALFGVNRSGVMSFRESDHGDGVTGLKEWAAKILDEAGISCDGGRIELLCYPRMFGFVFNPLSVYFCHDRDGRLAGLLYEVSNTHGERHTYVMPAGSDPVVQHSARKAFFVSPFLPMDCTYRFRIQPPGKRVDIVVLEDDPVGLLLTARFSGQRREFTDTELFRMLVSYPLMTLKVVAAIHWEAMKLLAKGMPFHRWHRAERRVAHSAPLSKGLTPQPPRLVIAGANNPAGL